jgi:3-carboxy-cis,cis-muconate cycloisomerase
MAQSIRARTSSTAEMSAVFADAALIEAALAFERELAFAEADAGVITKESAEAIGRACAAFDAVNLAEDASHAGTLAIPVVSRLRAWLSVHAPFAAPQVHLGATSQDLSDTALVLQMKCGFALLDRALDDLERELERLAGLHRRTPALGRTLLQPAEPITFGMRTGNWLLGVDAAHERLVQEIAGALRIELGGAVGSLSRLGEAGPKVRDGLARRLGLSRSISWHARRDSIVGSGVAIAMVIGAVAKIARDVSLLMQAEVGEVFEPEIEGRGGSSAMKHKHNPTGCQVALSAGIRAAGLCASLLFSMPQEEERGLGGWQAEGPVIAELFELAHGAISAMGTVARGLVVDVGTMGARVREAEPEAIAAAAAFVEEALALHAASMSRVSSARLRDPLRAKEASHLP